jgi:Dolichyl-phosphate-mannose-protein mannosyltransferase
MHAPHKSSLSGIERDYLVLACMAGVFLTILYTTLYALLSPVTVWDSMTYNLARLQLAENYGFWHHEYYNTPRQYSFVWGFDAVHWPFVKLGFAYGLPSLACFLGTLWIAYKILQQTYGSRITWLALLGLCALPTLVQQGMSTKNDIPLVFGVACFIYATWRYYATHSSHHIMWAAAAIGFTSGAKGTGLVFGFIMGLCGLWLLRKSRPALRVFCLACAVSMILLGSLESYVNNRLRGDGWFGHPTLVKPHQNQDGLAGTLANFVRYHFSVVDIGVDVHRPESAMRLHLERNCLALLDFIGLRDLGTGPAHRDNNLAFLRDKQEAAWTFGPIGFAALCSAWIILFTKRLKSSEWGLAAGGMISLLAICATVAWMPWNNRFLLVPFSLFTVALAIAIGTRRKSPVAARLFVAIGLFTIVAYALEARPRNPRDLHKTIVKRTWFTTRERTTMLEVLRYLKREKDKYPGGIWVAAGGDSWIFPVYDMAPDRFHSLPHPTPEKLAEIFSEGKGRGRALLTLNRSDLTEATLPTLHQVAAFEENTAFFIPISQP